MKWEGISKIKDDIIFFMYHRLWQGGTTDMKVKVVNGMVVERHAWGITGVTGELASYIRGASAQAKGGGSVVLGSLKHDLWI